MARKRKATGRPKIDLPDDLKLRDRIKKDIMDLDPETRASLLSELKVRDPSTAIPKERVGEVDGIHDVYVFPLGSRTPCAVVVMSAYDNRHVLAAICTKRPSRTEAVEMAAVALHGEAA